MKKSDLRNRVVVESRCGDKYIVCGDELLCVDGWVALWYYNDDLTHNEFSEKDIVKVYDKANALVEVDTTELLWERKWKPDKGEEYYLASPISIRTPTDVYEWSGDEYDNEWYDRGLVFQTKEEAIECAKKMLDAIKEEK